MALKPLSEQIEITNQAMIQASVTRSKKNLDRTFEEYGKLKKMLEGFTSFVEHNWEVKLYTKDSNVTIKIKAEHLQEARDTAIELIDTFDNAIRFELYCDGKQIPEHE